MTRVYAKSGGGRYLFAAYGHATGSPEVCAAISSIVYALAGYLTNEPEGTDVPMRLESGNAVVQWSGGEKAEAVFELAVIGVRQIEAKYPELVTVDQTTFQDP